MGISAFPKIFTIGDNKILDIFNEEVEISEKVDGSMFCVANINNELFMRSKGAIIHKEVYDKSFEKAVLYSKYLYDNKLLPNNIIFYGEYLKAPKHNILTYNRVPKNNIILFGACDLSGKFFNDFYKYAEQLNLESVPILFKGKINKVEDILELLNTESILGGCKIEGIVVKNYNRRVVINPNMYLDLMCGKYVSEQFKEKHIKNWKGEFTNKGKFELFKDQYRTEARWHKALQHLREDIDLKLTDQGYLPNLKITNTPKDIGILIKEVQRDLSEEEKDNIKEELWRIFSGDILRNSVRGLPEWYKKYLLERSFE